MSGAMAQAAAPQPGQFATSHESSRMAGSGALGKGFSGDALLEQLIVQATAPPQLNNQLPSLISRANAVNIVTSKPQMSRTPLQQPTKADRIQEGLEKTVRSEYV